MNQDPVVMFVNSDLTNVQAIFDQSQITLFLIFLMSTKKCVSKPVHLTVSQTSPGFYLSAVQVF